MAINNDGVFDPSKRIRATLGEEFTANVEADALNRIVSQANIEGNSEQKITGPVRNQFDPSEIMSKIEHSNPRNNVKSQLNNASNISRNEALNNTVEKFKDMRMDNRSVPAKILMKTTGFDKAKSRAENITNVGCTLANITTGVTLQYIADDYIRKNNKFVNVVGAGLAGAAIDFASSYWFSGNKDTVEGLFDPNGITSAEANIINKAIRKEHLVYASEHTLIGYVAPLVMSKTFNKILPEKAKNNKLVGTITSFGVLSSVSKLALQGIRTLKTNKDINALNGCSYAITEGQPCEAYEIIAKYAARSSIDGQIDGSIYGSVGAAIGKSIMGVAKEKTNEKPALVKLEIKEPVKKETVKAEKVTA